MFHIIKWWFKYRFLMLKPKDKVIVYFPDRTCPAEVYRAKWIFPRLRKEKHFPLLVFNGGWQLQLWFDPEPFGMTRNLPGATTIVKYGKYDVELPAGDGRLFGVVNQCRDYGGIHIERVSNEAD